MKPEIRTITAQLRAKTEDGKTGACGYAAVFNQTADIGYFKERIASGAFSRALKERQDVRCLVNHDENLVLGRTKANTLSLREDNTGLYFDCDFPATTTANDLKVSLDRGDIDQCSFAFAVRKQTWTQEQNDDGDMDELRTIEDVDLFDVSIVTYPAYDGTSAALRSAPLAVGELPEDMPAEVRTRIEAKKTGKRTNQDGCDCDCPECQDNNCDGCSMTDCDDPNCRCSMMRAERARRRVQIASAD